MVNDDVPSVPTPEDLASTGELLKMLVAGVVMYGAAKWGMPIDAALGAGLVQGSNPAIDLLRDRWSGRIRRNADRALASAADRCHMDPETLARRVAEDPELLTLTVTALQTASETAYTAKVELMGKVIANAFHDRALVDDAALITRAVRQLEAPHFRVLAILAKPEPRRPDGEPRLVGRRLMEIANRAGWPLSSVTAVVLSLQSAACVTVGPAATDGGAADTDYDAAGMLDGHVCEITRFGIHVIEEIHPDAA